MNSTRRTLIVFGREPMPGKVKTRLIPMLGPEGASAVYEQLLEQTLTTAAALGHCARQLWLDEWKQSSMIASTAESLGFERHTQHGADLGERMGHAFSTALQQPGSAVLIGTDCPGYTPSYLEAAFAALQDHDAVIGPAADGGYVLLGLREVSRRLFEDIAWSTGSVLTETRQRLVERHWRWHELPVQHDIDDPDDLCHLPPGMRPAPQP